MFQTSIFLFCLLPFFALTVRRGCKYRALERQMHVQAFLKQFSDFPLRIIKELPLYALNRKDGFSAIPLYLDVRLSDLCRSHIFVPRRGCQIQSQTTLLSLLEQALLRDWQTHTVVDFTDRVIIWLIKWNVWNQTGYWIGDETSHNKISLLLSISAIDQCWRGSGVLYGNCHQLTDKLEVNKDIPHSVLISLLANQLIRKNNSNQTNHH